MSQIDSYNQNLGNIVIMIVGLQISILGVVFSNHLVLIGAALTFSVVVKLILS